MPLLQVPDMPEDLYETLSRVAEADNRSIAQETIVLLRKALGNKEERAARRKRILAEITLNKIDNVGLLPKEATLRTLKYCYDIVYEYVDISKNGDEALAESIRLNHPTHDLLYMTIARRTGGAIIVSGQMESLYKVQKKDIPKAGAVLADAFQHDPVWTRLLEDEAGIDQKGAVFESPIRYGLRYGEVYATSEHMEGIAVWVPGERADMTLWRLIRSGAVFSGMRALKAFKRRTWKKAGVLGPMRADRKAAMKGRSYIYLVIIGVASEFQGHGFGRKLLGALIEKSERLGLPLYLETETERNVKLYERAGFTVVNQIILPVVKVPMWEMIREPKT